jgi:L-alanine-DL-glutamate epimerase-like enolase superfamily enzyme
VALNEVTDLSCRAVRVVFRAPVRFGSELVMDRWVSVLRLADAEGRTGLGESPLPLGGDTIAAAKDGLLGRTPMELVKLGGTWSMPGIPAGVAAAIDAALLDLAARQADTTVARLLGADPGRTDVAVNGLLEATRDPAAGAAAAVGLASQGYACLKVKLAGAEGGSPPDWWIPALDAIRAAAGDTVALRVDLNGALTVDAALRWLPRIATLGLDYVEQPVAPEAGGRAVAGLRSAGVPIAADESVTGPDAADRLLDDAAYDALVVKPGRVGGPLAALAIVRAASLHRVPVTISTFYDTSVGLATALHVAAAVPGDAAHGLATAGLLANDPAGGLPAIRRGRLELVGPGLGVTLGPEMPAGIPA